MRETFAFFPDRYTIVHELGARSKTIVLDRLVITDSIARLIASRRRIMAG